MDSRWSIETAHQEAKAHGAGQARNRVRRAVQRTIPFAFLAQTITITWYRLHGADAAPWYRHKQTISYNDMLPALRRELSEPTLGHKHRPRPPTAKSRPSPSHPGAT